MARRKHIIIDNPGLSLDYTKPSGGGGTFRSPPRERRSHANKLLSDLTQATNDADSQSQATGHVVHGICLEIIGEEDYELKIESLQDRKLKPPIEVLSAKRINNQLHTTIYVPEGKLENFVRKIERYRDENNARSGRPQNEDLVAGISEIRFPVLRSFWTDDEELFPHSSTENILWEVWIQVAPDESPDDAFASFVSAVSDSNLRLSSHPIKFPERLVFLAYGSAQDWIQIFVPLLDRIAEFRKAKEVPTEFLDLSHQDQREFVADLASRIIPPAVNSPSVCLLDHGVHVEHPLLRPLINNGDAQTYDPDWPIVDNAESHGTEMAGLALFGDSLPDLLMNSHSVKIEHRIESVRMLNTGQPHHRDTWGYVTIESLSKAESQAPQRQRVACLPVTSNDLGRDHGRPSSWSAAIDQHASGQLDEGAVRRLYLVSAGNIQDIVSNQDYRYPDTNYSSSVEDPAQSWNALTVGAFTEKIQIRSEDFDGYQLLAPRGGLCPTSRTSDSWDDKVWPIKPDIVMEGGNYARSPEGRIDGCEDLALLTTSLDPTGRLLTWSSDTSAATAQAARLSAMLMADYPNLWPETIRGLLVHSAEWTDEMRRQIPGERETDKHKRLRCFGYGVPDIDKARYTVENCVSLVHQGVIQPYKLDGSEDKTNHFVLHSLPWPTVALRQLHDQDVTVKITLSYFIEPSPAGRGWGKKFRYASHGLRFALKGPTETENQFRQRISSQEWEEEEDGRPSTSDPINWEIGRLRTRGSIHCDWWTASAAQVADCGQVAVFPVTGWWRERKHLGCVEKQTRYSLIITISTPATDVDLYTPIAQQIGLVTEIPT